MRYVMIALIVYLAAALQTTIIEACRIGGVEPHLPAMAAVAVVLLLRNDASLAIVAVIGLLEDSLSSGRLGIAMACYLILSWALLQGCERFGLRSLGQRIVATGLFAGTLVLAIGTTRVAIGEPTRGLLTIGIYAGGIALYTSAVAIPFWTVLGWSEIGWSRHLAKYEL